MDGRVRAYQWLARGTGLRADTHTHTQAHTYTHTCMFTARPPGLSTESYDASPLGRAAAPSLTCQSWLADIASWPRERPVVVRPTEKQD